jgi:hypothetical protein
MCGWQRCRVGCTTLAMHAAGHLPVQLPTGISTRGCCEKLWVVRQGLGRTLARACTDNRTQSYLAVHEAAAAFGGVLRIWHHSQASLAHCGVWLAVVARPGRGCKSLHECRSNSWRP